MGYPGEFEFPGLSDDVPDVDALQQQVQEVESEVARLAKVDEACRLEVVGRHHAKAAEHAKAVKALADRLSRAAAARDAAAIRQVERELAKHRAEVVRHRDVMARCLVGQSGMGFLSGRKGRKGGVPMPMDEEEGYGPVPAPQQPPWAMKQPDPWAQQPAMDPWGQQQFQMQPFDPWGQMQMPMQQPMLPAPVAAPAPAPAPAPVPDAAFVAIPGAIATHTTSGGRLSDWDDTLMGVESWSLDDVEGSDDGTSEYGLADGTDASVVYSSRDDAGCQVTGDSVVTPLERAVLLRDALRRRCRRWAELRRAVRCPAGSPAGSTCRVKVRVKVPCGRSEERALRALLAREGTLSEARRLDDSTVLAAKILEDAHLGGDGVLYGFGRDGRLFGVDEAGALFSVETSDDVRARGPASGTPAPVQVRRGCQAPPARVTVDPSMAQGSMGRWR